MISSFVFASPFYGFSDIEFGYDEQRHAHPYKSTLSRLIGSTFFINLLVIMPSVCNCTHSDRESS